MNLFEIPAAADLRAFAGMPALRHVIARRLIDEMAEVGATECAINLGFYFFTPAMREAVAAEMREKGYTVVVCGHELAVTWGEDLLG